mmetsp:Transcript_106378/g.205970  ORF Transcript_106378/g.205970 Transcript_106378/m.205970 type:complete len:101 (-) Transcript_106378:81-383(-)
MLTSSFAVALSLSRRLCSIRPWVGVAVVFPASDTLPFARAQGLDMLLLHVRRMALVQAIGHVQSDELSQDHLSRLSLLLSVMAAGHYAGTALLRLQLWSY